MMQGMEEANMDVGEGCEGVGEEECLMRRTLAAHTDYIYTQKENSPWIVAFGLHIVHFHLIGCAVPCILVDYFILYDDCDLIN